MRYIVGAILACFFLCGCSDSAKERAVSRIRYSFRELPTGFWKTEETNDPTMITGVRNMLQGLPERDFIPENTRISVNHRIIFFANSEKVEIIIVYGDLFVEKHGKYYAAQRLLQYLTESRKDSPEKWSLVDGPTPSMPKDD